MSDVTLKQSSSRTFRCIFYKALGHTACLTVPPSAAVFGIGVTLLLSCAAAAENHVLKWYRNPVQIVSETRGEGCENPVEALRRRRRRRFRRRPLALHPASLT
jgi:hypothetical protein